ncbi:MAG: OmpA family protein [Acidimicrobiales bacterium]
MIRALLASAALVLAGCSHPQAARPPVLAPTGAEAAVAATVPGGPERLPTFQRREDGTATLVIPADVLFATDSAELGPAAATVLQQIVAEARPPATVLVEGFADGDGEAAYNQALSERRAASVAAWLTANGVQPSAVTTRGWGETRPAVPEVDDGGVQATQAEAAKAQNRRVVVTVTATQTTRRSS